MALIRGYDQSVKFIRSLCTTQKSISKFILNQLKIDIFRFEKPSQNPFASNEITLISQIQKAFNGETK